MNPLLGFITPAQRTKEQEDAHAAAVAKMIKHNLRFLSVPKGTKIILTDSWRHSDVIADVGRPMLRTLQNTGSCVWAGGSSGLKVTIGTQRLVADKPIKAYEPFTLHNYAMSRHAIGDDSEGEGSLGSTFAESLGRDGVRDWPQDKGDVLPDYTITGEHLNVTAREELAWSSYRNRAIAGVLAESKPHPTSTTEAKSGADVVTLLANGYGGSFACSRFIGKGEIRGSGDTAYVRGKWDNNGGHQQWTLAVWHHPNDGLLIGVGNNWPDDTYPKDPAGLPLCCVWVGIEDVDAAFRYDAEVYNFSAQSWFPAQPKVIESWADLIP